MREGAKLLYGKSVYLKLLFLTRPNFATYDHSSKNETTVDAHGRYIHTLPRIVVYIPEEYPYGIYTYFRVWVNICHAWAFCSCPFLRFGQCEGLRCVERAKGKNPRILFLRAIKQFNLTVLTLGFCQMNV